MEAGIWAFGWNLDLEAGIWALRLKFGPGHRDMGLYQVFRL